MAWLLHELPGRLRVREPAIKGHPASAAALAAKLRALPGVTRASASAVTGSVVVEHGGARGAILRSLDIDPQSPSAVSPASTDPGPIESLAAAITEWLLEHALRAAVTALT